MTMQSRRQVLLTAGVLATSITLAACSSPAKPENPNVQGEVAGKVDWVYPGTSDVERKFAQGFVQQITTEYPKLSVSVNYLSWNDMQKSLAVRLQANNPPDVTATQDITALVGMDGLADLNGYLGANAPKPDEFLPGTYDYSSKDGKLYSVPYLATGFTLIVNEKLLNAAGFKLEDLKTWTDLQKAAAAMTKGDVKGFAYPLGNPRFVFRGALTAAYSDNLQMNDVSDGSRPKWAALLEHLKTMASYGPAAQTTWDYPDMWRAFANGKLGMVAGGTYYTANVYSINPAIVADSRQVSYPAGPSSDKPRTPVSSVGYAMFKNAKNPAGAWAMISSLTSPANVLQQAAAVNLPARKNVDREALQAAAAKIYPNAAAGHKRITDDGFAVLDEYGVPLTKIPGQPDMEPALQEIMVRYLGGKISTDDAVNQIVERIGKINKDYGTK